MRPGKNWSGTVGKTRPKMIMGLTVIMKIMMTMGFFLLDVIFNIAWIMARGSRPPAIACLFVFEFFT
jgi:type IV secretory pathway VirB3-like protein